MNNTYESDLERRTRRSIQGQADKENWANISMLKDWMKNLDRYVQRYFHKQYYIQKNWYEEKFNHPADIHTDHHLELTNCAVEDTLRYVRKRHEVNKYLKSEYLSLDGDLTIKQKLAIIQRRFGR